MKHLTRLREALLQMTGQTAPSTALHQTLDLLESELSHDQVRQALRNAIQVTRAENEPYRWRWITDVYDSYFIFRDDVGDESTLYKADYSIDANGAATVGAFIPVRMETSYVPVESATDVLESGNATRIAETVISLREARAIGDDGSMLIKIISPGTGSSGRYSRELLERDIPRIFPAGTHMYADHPTMTESIERPERSVKDLAAVTQETPFWLEEADAPEGEGMYTKATPFASYAGDLEDKASAIGVSINALGTATIGNDGIADITSLTEGFSIDFVTKAGRDGKIVSLKESTRSKPAPSPQPSPTPTPSPTPSPSQENTVNDQEAAQLRESARQSDERAATADQRAASAERQLAEARLAPQVRTFVEAELKTIEMPDAMRAKLTESLVARPVLKDGAIDEDAFKTAITDAATSELTYAQEAFNYGKGNVTGAGSGAAPSDSTATVKMNESLRAARHTIGLS